MAERERFTFFTKSGTEGGPDCLAFCDPPFDLECEFMFEFAGAAGILKILKISKTAVVGSKVPLIS